MSGFDSLFSGLNFRGTIEKYAAQAGWRIAEANNDLVVLKFNMDSGRPKTIFVFRGDKNISFHVPSIVQFASENDIPHYLSTLLLKRNGQIAIGKWSITVINNQHVFSCEHSVDMKLMDAAFFARAVVILIKECDEMESALQAMMRNR